VRNVILSGGVAHDFPATSAALADVLGEVGFRSRVREDLESVLADLDGVGLVTVNLLRWRMETGRYAHLRGRWGLSLGEAAREALRAHVEGGGGLLAMHSAPICFDDWPQWEHLLGGAWIWGRSCHPPLGPVRVSVRTGAHPIVAGIGDFALTDEVYGFLRLRGDVVPLMTSPHGGADHPLLWAREVGRGRVVYDALGHHPESYDCPEHRAIVQRAAHWALGARPALRDRPM
jgi:uncharacterized protein